MIKQLQYEALWKEIEDLQKENTRLAIENAYLRTDNKALKKKFINRILKPKENGKQI